jgi:hypothetical protein
VEWSNLSRTPPSRTLRQFAGTGFLFFTGVACWQGLVCGHAIPGLVFAGLAATIGPLGLLWPRTIRPVYLAAVVLAFPIGWLVSRTVLAILFFGLFTPLGLLFRLRGRDVLDLRFRPNAPTYWAPKPMPADLRRYFRQF